MVSRYTPEQILMLAMLAVSCRSVEMEKAIAALILSADKPPILVDTALKNIAPGEFNFVKR